MNDFYARADTLKIIYTKYCYLHTYNNPKQPSWKEVCGHKEATVKRCEVKGGSQEKAG